MLAPRVIPILGSSSRPVRGASQGPTPCGRFRTSLLCLLPRHELQGRRVHAVAQPGRLGSVGEDVSEVGVAGGAEDLDATHPVAEVLLGPDGVAADRCPEAGPPRPGVVLGVGVEELVAAAGAAVDAVALEVPVLAGGGALGALLAADVVLLRRELPAPLFVGLDDLPGHRLPPGGDARTLPGGWSCLYATRTEPEPVPGPRVRCRAAGDVLDPHDTGGPMGHRLHAVLAAMRRMLPAVRSVLAARLLGHTSPLLALAAPLVLLAAPLVPIPAPVFAQDSRSSAPFDVLIVGGKVLDGTGNPWFYADVGIRDGKIVAVGRLEGARATRVIDARGLFVAPGFIDLHSHADDGASAEGGFRDPDPRRRAAPNGVAQGVTTVVVHQDGRSPWPTREQRAFIEANGIGPNAMLMVGHGTVRRLAMGDDFRRPATPEEIERMRALVRQGLEEGAVGLSAGLEYVPGRWSTTDELVALVE